MDNPVFSLFNADSTYLVYVGYARQYLFDTILFQGAHAFFQPGGE